MNMVQEWQVSCRLGSVHCKEVAVQVTLDSFLRFPDENLTKSRHFGYCCVLTNGLTNGRWEEGAGGWERGLVLPLDKKQGVQSDS